MSESLPRKLPESEALLQRLYQDALVPADKKPIVVDSARLNDHFTSNLGMYNCHFA